MADDGRAVCLSWWLNAWEEVGPGQAGEFGAAILILIYGESRRHKIISARFRRKSLED